MKWQLGFINEIYFKKNIYLDWFWEANINNEADSCYLFGTYKETSKKLNV